MDEAIRNFHRLGGAEISEHKKRFNAYKAQLLHSPHSPRAILAQIHARGRQEQLFKIELLRAYGMHAELYAIVTSGDKMNGSAILKKGARFLCLFDGVNARDFAEEHCAGLSYVMRVKIINRLALRIADCGVGEEYFVSVKGKYGLKVATVLLCACGEDFIRSVLTEYDLKLNQRVLVHLHRKYPRFLQWYYVQNPRAFASHTKVARFLVGNNDLLLLDVLLAYGVPKLGKRSLRKLGENAAFIYARTHKNALRFLPPKHTLPFLTQKLPKSLLLFNKNEEITDCLKALPRSKRALYLLAAFRAKYGRDIRDESSLINPPLLRLFTPDHRQLFNLSAHPEFTNCLPLLQREFLATTHKRTEIAVQLINTCEINADRDALTRVLRFFRAHFNPPSKECLESLAAMDPAFTSGEHWRLINELRLCYEATSKDVWYQRDPLLAFILYQLLNGETCTDDDIRTNYERTNNYFRAYNALDDHPVAHRRYLIRLCDVLPRAFADEDDEMALSNALYTTLYTISTFNKSHRGWAIEWSVYAKHVARLARAVRANRAKCGHYVYFIGQLLSASKGAVLWDEDVLLELAVIAHTDGVVYLWFLKHRPDLLLRHSSLFFDGDDLPSNAFYELAKMDFNELHRVIKNEAIARLERGGCGKDVVCSIKFLSHIQDVDLEPMVSKYLPDAECVIDATDPSTEQLLPVQRAVIASIKHASPPARNLPRIAYYCKRDYLKYALEPLYYTICYSPENTITETMEGLLKGGVSVRKHTLHLLSVVGTRARKLEVLERFARNETNKSLKGFAFRKIVRAFFDERDQISYNMLRRDVKVGVLNYDGVRLLNALDKVPARFYSGYLEMFSSEIDCGSLECDARIERDFAERVVLKCAARKFTAEYFLRADFDCSTIARLLEPIQRQQNGDLSKRVENTRARFDFLEFVCVYYVENNISENSERKVEILNGLSEIFTEYELKYLLDLTRIFLLNSKLLYAHLNIAFIEQLTITPDYQTCGNNHTYTQHLNNQGIPTEFTQNVPPKNKHEAQINQHLDITLNQPIKNTIKPSIETVIANNNFIDTLKTFLKDYKEQSVELYGVEILPIFADFSRRFLDKLFAVVYGDSFDAHLRLIDALLSENQPHLMVLCTFLLPTQCVNIAGFKEHRRKIIGRIERLNSNEYFDLYVQNFAQNV